MIAREEGFGGVNESRVNDIEESENIEAGDMLCVVKLSCPQEASQHSNKAEHIFSLVCLRENEHTKPGHEWRLSLRRGSQNGGTNSDPQANSKAPKSTEF